MEYFKASHDSWRDPIEKVEVERETEQSVFIKSRNGKEERHAKISGRSRYFDSFDGAKDWLIASSLSDIVAARKRLKEVEETLAKYEGLKNS